MLLALRVYEYAANASLTSTEDDDALSASAAVLVQSSLAVTEADDSLDASSAVTITASATVTEADDTDVAAESADISASLAVTESDDTLLADVISVVAQPVAPGDSAGAFSRKRWSVLRELLAAKRADNAKTKQLKVVAKKKLKIALKAAQVVAEKLDIIDLRPIAAAIDASFGAKTLADLISQSEIILRLSAQYRAPKSVDVEHIEPLPEEYEPPIERRPLRPRPNGRLPPLVAVTYDIDELLEDRRVAALERARSRIKARRAKEAAALAEQDRLRNQRRKAREHREEIARACQAHMAQSINRLLEIVRH